MKLEEEKINTREVIEKLQNADDKPAAIVEIIDEIVSQKYNGLINEIKEESEKAIADGEFAKSLNLRNLSNEEKKFYEALKDVKQAIVGNQIDIVPTTIVDITMEEIKAESNLLTDLVDFAPANVTKWISASKTGTFHWGNLTAALGNNDDITATIAAINVELAKLTAYIVIPKAIRDLSLPFVDKYFRAVLKEVMSDGMVNGALVGNGKEAPIGIYKSIENSTNGVHADKDVDEQLTRFTPKGLAEAKKYLSNNGKRSLDELLLVCNPADEADYVAPALYDEEGRMISSFKNLKVYAHSENPLGKAALVIPKKYTMGFSGLKIDEYDQTKAMDDADVVIAKVYANGRTVDDNTAYVFDVTKLEEYVRNVRVVNIAEG